MAHFYQPTLEKPASFNFATDVVDYWASKSSSLLALYHLSADNTTTTKLTYGDISRQSHRLALLFDDLGIRKGEKMVMIMPRLPVWWELATAALRTGVVLCPATTLLVSNDIAFRVQRARATVYVGDSVSVAKFLAVKDDCPSVKHVIQTDTSSSSAKAGVLSLQVALSKISSDAVWTGQSPKATDPAMIYFTSGTTGYPKMVQHNHLYPLAHTLTGKHWLRLTPGKVYWNLSEQGWAKAAFALFGAWNCGAALFVHDDRGAFDGKKVLGVLNKFPITTFCAPPTAYRQLVLGEMQEVFSRIPPKALQHCVGAGEPLNAEVIRLWKQMSGLEICDGFGQTECIIVCGNLEGKEIRGGSMGVPLPGVPLFVVNDKGEECAVGVEGDICIEVDGKSGFFGVFQGYLQEDGTLDSRISVGEDGRRWYKTGDRATRDKDAYFWFVGRNDDVINSSGYRIGPFEVESTLKQHPAVIESAVISSPDKDRGEVVKAFVVLTPQYTEKDASKLVKELQDFCKDKAAPYKYPRKIQFVGPDFLPKTISGKIKRNELKKMEWSGDGQAARAKL